MDPKQLNFYRSLIDQVADRIENPYAADAVYLRKLADEVLPALCGTPPIYQVWSDEAGEYVTVTQERYASCLPAARRIVYGEKVAADAVAGPMTQSQRAVIFDAMRSVSEHADGIKAGGAIGDEWPDAEDKAYYDAQVNVLDRLRELYPASVAPAAVAPITKEWCMKMAALEPEDGVPPAGLPAYSAPFTTDVPQCCGDPATCNDPCQAPTERMSDAAREETPSLTNPLTPYGMLVRALRIVAGTTLMDMANYLGRGPAELSSLEFGRKPVRNADIVDAAHYFASFGIHNTTHELTIAAHKAEIERGKNQS
jgi:hypothetical protein